MIDMELPRPEAPKKLPWQTVAHDGRQAEVTGQERQLVTQKFNSVIDDIMLNHPDSVRHVTITHPKDVLSLKLPISTNDFWSIGVERQEIKKSTAPTGLLEPAAIRLQHIKDQLEVESVDYYLDTDGVVRRKMLGSLKEKVQLDVQDEAQDPTKGLDLAIEQGENQRLERVMGVNMQPISLEEMDQLIELITDDDVTVRPNL